ncbi:DUF1002 domain-containing protein [Methanobacterium sp. ACI-7]|uniref:DUF1002 domain-containing protein n=1 Tax=unclassified Methanobacterium TaxID=2627676 RepID=UPI0039C1164E
MKKLIVGMLLLFMAISPIYGASGFAITFGETTYANPQWKSSTLDYFDSHTDKKVVDATTKVITASEVNQIAKDITGRTYSSKQIFSCAMVDLSYSQGIKVIVDKSKIGVVTSKMYANALKSSGIENGYVVVTAPVQSSGEAALTGVLKSYEVAVGAPIPESAKKAATEELYTEQQIANQTGQNPDKVADLFEQAKNEVQKQNLQDPAQIKIIVINIANNMNININDAQAQQIAEAIANSQKVQGELAGFKQQLQDVTNQVSQSQGILNQIMIYLQQAFDYISSLISGQ